MAAELSAAHVERLAREGSVEPVSRRARLPLDAPVVTIVVEGWFRLFRHAAFVRDVTLALAGRADVLAPGWVFGERSAESGAEALTEGVVLRVAPETFARLGAAEPAVLAGLARGLARRTLHVQRKLETLGRASLEARVAAALLEIGAAAGTPLGEGRLRLDLPLSQEDLAGLAGTTRESCSSTVASLARAGLVRGSRLRGLVLLDPPALAARAAIDLRQP